MPVNGTNLASMVAPFMPARCARHLIMALPEAERSEDHQANGDSGRRPIPGGKETGQVRDAVNDQANELARAACSLFRRLRRIEAACSRGPCRRPR